MCGDMKFISSVDDQEKSYSGGQTANPAGHSFWCPKNQTDSRHRRFSNL